MDQLLTAKEISSFLHVHPKTIYRWSSEGRLPHRKINGSIRFKKDEIEAFQQKYPPIKISQPGLIPKLDLTLSYYDRILLKGESAVSNKKQRWNYGFGTIYVREFKGKSRFCVDYNDHLGKRIRRIIPHVQTREEAVLYLQSKVTEIFDRKHNTKRLSQIRFDKFASLYLNDYAKTNKRSWKTDEYRLKAMLPYFGRYELQMITSRDIERFRAERIKAGNTQSTTNRSLTLLKKMLNLAIDWGYLKENPVTKVKMFPEYDVLKEKVLTKEEEQRLLAASPDHLRAIIILALNTGMRRGEILKLRWEDIDLKNRTITLRKTKSGRTRTVPINDQVFELLNGMKCKVDNVFPYTYIQTAFENSRRRAGLSVRFHDLRHTFASRLVANGVDIVTVQKLLGHQNITTTERYMHSNTEQKRNAVNTLSRICHADEGEDPKTLVNRSFSIN